MTEPTASSRRWQPHKSPIFWLVGVPIGIVLLIAIATGGLLSLLVIGGIVTLISGIHSFATGRTGWLSIPSRSVAIKVAGISLVVVIAGALSAPPQTATEEVAADASVVVEHSSGQPRSFADLSPARSQAVTTDESVDSAVPFAAVTQDDPSLTVGTQIVTTVGIDGVLTTTHRVSAVDGSETKRVLVSEIVTRAPVDQVTSVGTQPLPVAAPVSPSCDPNYSGCVPIDSDVDCAGGSGDGPSYLSGSVNVIGRDIYGLDRDKNGIACD